MYIETTLSYDQKLDILFHAADAYGNTDNDNRDQDDIAHEIVDNWVPLWRDDIVKAWCDAQCPEPEDYDLKGSGWIWQRMTQAVYAVAHAYLLAVISEAENVGEAIDLIVKQRDIVENPAKYWREIANA